jgi:hypothetical protein
MDGSPSQICADDPAAPKSTWNPPRRTFTWAWVPAVGAPGPGPVDGGAAGTTLSPCTANGRPTDPGVAVRCRGVAAVRGSGKDVALAFIDGNVLRWDTSGVPTPVRPPAVAAGAMVWVEYLHQMPIVCPFCGAYRHDELQIREREGGKLLWIAREGQVLDDLDEALVRELFGVGARERVQCQQAIDDAGCYTVERTVLDHVLATTPEQTLRHAQLEHVTTPGGAWEVVWAATRDVGKRINQCQDGPGVAHDTGFAASRTSP